MQTWPGQCPGVWMNSMPSMICSSAMAEIDLDRCDMPLGETVHIEERLALRWRNAGAVEEYAERLGRHNHTLFIIGQDAPIQLMNADRRISLRFDKSQAAEVVDMPVRDDNAFDIAQLMDLP